MPCKIGKILIAISILLCSPVVADTLNHVPTGTRVTKGNITYECFDLPKYKLLLNLDKEHDACLTKSVMLDLKIGQYEQVLLDYEQIIRAHESSVGILQKENDRLFKSWSEENKKRHEAENRPYLSSSLGWTTAGVMTIVSGVLTVILIAQ